MRHRTVKPLKDILGEVVRGMGIEGPLARGHVIATWENIMSPQMKQHIEKCWVKGDRLFVKVSAASWRQELHLRREDWRRRLNEELGADSIREIIFR